VVAKRERAFSALARRQHGVISRRQLIAGGLGVRTISRRIEAGQLHLLHRGVYLLGDGRVDRRAEWMAAVLACGDGALLSHGSACALWGLARFRKGPIDVTSAIGRQRPRIVVHEGAIGGEDRAEIDRIPVTTIARTLFDFAEVSDEEDLRRAAEEADRLRLLRIPELEAVCARCPGRRALRPMRRLIDVVRLPDDTQSPLEDLVLELCRKHDLPMPVVGATVLGREVDAFWPDRKLMVEADSWQFHGHRAAFEDDRARDASMQAEGYRVIRLTHRRLEREPATVAGQLRRLLGQPLREGRAGA
jgi:very-short-patch-repair endonuclease